MKITRDTTWKLEHAPPFIRLLSSILIYILSPPSPPRPKNLGVISFSSSVFRTIFLYDLFSHRSYKSSRLIISNEFSFYSTAFGGDGIYVGGRGTVFTVNEIFTTCHVEVREPLAGSISPSIIGNYDSFRARSKQDWNVTRSREYVHARMFLWYFQTLHKSFKAAKQIINNSVVSFLFFRDSIPSLLFPEANRCFHSLKIIYTRVEESLYYLNKIRINRVAIKSIWNSNPII